MTRHGRPNKASRSLHDDQLMLKRDINPAIGGMKADEVSKADIIGVLEAVATRGARYRSNRVLALARSIYRWGIAEVLVQFDPTLGLRPRTIERPRERILSDDEVRAYGRALRMRPWARPSPPFCVLPS